MLPDTSIQLLLLSQRLEQDGNLRDSVSFCLFISKRRIGLTSVVADLELAAKLHEEMKYEENNSSVETLPESVQYYIDNSPFEVCNVLVLRRAK